MNKQTTQHPPTYLTLSAQSSRMSTRCFISVDIQTPAIINNLTPIQQQIQPLGHNTRVDPQQLHITMNFIGDVHQGALAQINKDLEGVEETSFQIEVHGLGVFPHMNFIRIVWAGIQQGHENLHQLATAIQTALDDNYVQEQEFHPHITLARINKISEQEKSTLQELIKQYEETSFGQTTVNGFQLKKSVLTPEGPEHTTIKRYPLHEDR